MKPLKSGNVVKNYAYQLFYQIYISIAPLITAPYISRILQPEGVGIYSYATTIALYFALFSKLGIENYGNREIANAKNDPKRLNEVFTQIEVLHLMVSFTVMVAYFVYAFVICKDNKIIAILFSINLISEVFNINWFFQGMECFKMISIRNIIVKTITVISVFVFVKDYNDLPIYTIIVVLGNLISVAVVWPYLPKYASFTRIKLSSVFARFKQLLILFIPAIAVSLYRYMDKLMIGGMSGNEQLGFYENADKIVIICNTLIVTVGVVMMPRISNLIASNEYEKVFSSIRTSSSFIMLISFPITTGVIVVANKFVPIFFGDMFVPSAFILQLLITTVPIMAYANVIRTQFLIPFKWDITYSVSVILGAIVNIVANVCFIPLLGAVGASIGTILAEVTVCAVQMIATRKKLKHISLLSVGVPYLIMSAIMYFAVWGISHFTPSNVAGLLCDIAVGVVVYATLLIAYCLLNKKSDLRSLIREIKKL